MAVIIRWLLLTTLAFATVTQAQEKETPVSAPNPVALEADWWRYFEPATPIGNNELNTRIETTGKRLRQALARADSEQQSRLEPVVQRILDGLHQFSAQQQTNIDTTAQLSTLAASYTIQQALDVFSTWHKLKRETDLEEEDLSWQNAQLSLERKHQAQQRGLYLALETGNIKRLAQGLDLMAARINLELSTRKTRLRNSKVNQARTRIQHLQDELDIIHERLQPSADDEKAWLEKQSGLKEKISRIHQQAATPFAKHSLDTAAGAAKSKLFLLVASARDIQIATYELKAIRYQVMTALNQSLAQTKPAQQNKASLDAALSSFTQLESSIAEQQAAWQASTQQSKKYASAQIANIRLTDADASSAYQELAKQVDENEHLLYELGLELDFSGYIASLAQTTLQAGASWLSHWLTVSGNWLEGSWAQFGDWLNTSLFEISGTPVTSAGLLRVLIIISIAILISKFLRRGITRFGEKRQGVSNSALYTLRQLIHYIILTIGVIVALSSIGIDFTKFALFASALGVGIGFGLQTLISNFVAGLIILFERSLKAGDFVELSSGLSGEVKEINMRSTLITTNDNVDIIVPNSEFVNGQVTNWTLRDAQRRIHIPFGVAYGTDKDLVKKAALEAADEVTWTLKNMQQRHPQVWFVEFGDSSLNFELVVWLVPEAVKRPGAVQAAYLWELDTKLAKYGIEIPFPQRDLHLRSVFGQQHANEMALFNKENLDKPQGT